MAQYTVYENPSRASRKTFPFLLDIQADLLSDLRTTVVIPLCPAAAISDDIITKLCPVDRLRRSGDGHTNAIEYAFLRRLERSRRKIRVRCIDNQSCKFPGESHAASVLRFKSRTAALAYNTLDPH